VRRAGCLPLVLAGDSAVAPGVVAGARARRLLWLGVTAPGLQALLGQGHPGLVREPLDPDAVRVGPAAPEWLAAGPLVVHVDLATGAAIGSQLAEARACLAAVSVAGYDPVADADGGRLAAATEALRQGLVG
jgi:hypothetical protein